MNTAADEGLLQAEWYFDFLSPFAWLQWNRLPALRARLVIRPVPVVLGAILSHTGGKGPAEVAGKRAFTYRFVRWQAQRAGVPLRFPSSHPFNPLPALRLATALEAREDAVDAIFRAIWEGGGALDSAQALTPLAQHFGIADVAATIAAPQVKDALRTQTEDAIKRGVFGVPTLAIGEQLFWGDDATPMVLDWLDDPARFSDAESRRLDTLPIGVARA